MKEYGTSTAENITNMQGTEIGLYHHILNHINDESFVSKYIFSGLSPDRNLADNLTSQLFKDKFYVEFSEEIQLNYRTKLNQLFNDNSHGVLGIRAHGGSGKTTAIEMISTEVGAQSGVYKFTISFQAGDDKFTGAINRINKICKNRFKNRINNDPVFCLNILKNMKIIDSYFETLSNNDSVKYEQLIMLWGAIRKLSLNELLQQQVAITNQLRSLNGNDTIEGLQVALLFLCILLVSYSQNSSDFDKYLVIFDNIEFVTTNAIGDIIHSSWEVLSGIFEHLDDLYQNFKQIKFIVCARTTTGLGANQSNVGAWGDADKYIIDIKSGDFFAEALLKKLYYLHINGLKNTKTYNITKLICQLICGITNTENYLQDGQVHDTNKEVEYTFFAKRYFSPFFGNDFRLLASSLCDCLLNPQNEEAVKQITQLLNDSTAKTELYEIYINEARNILWHLIFKKLGQNGVLEYYGIQPIDVSEKNHSITRLILSYMYWHKIRHLVNNNWNEKNYSGIRFKHLTKSVLGYFYSEDTIAQTIYRLSNLCSPNDAEKRGIWKWYTHFITINTHSISESLQNGILDIETYGDVKLELSPAGICYVHHVSSHFEFFSARDIHNPFNPLIMCDFSQIEKSNGYIAIENIYNRVSDFIDGMLLNCRNGCINFRKQNTIACAYKKSTNNRLNYAEIFNCNLCVRILQANAVIISSIDYIDRYRQYVLSKEIEEKNRIAINNKLLDQIAKFAGLFEKTKKINHCPDNNFYNFLQNKIFPYYNTTDNSEKLEKLGLYQTLSNSRLLYYRKDKDTDYIYEAIKTAKSTLNPINDLYKICKELAESTK